MLLTKPLTGTVWVGDDLDLISFPVNLKGKITLIRTFNMAGKGYISFDPTRQANTLNVLRRGMVLLISAPSVVEADSSTYVLFEGTSIYVEQPVNTGYFALNSIFQL